MAKTRPSWPLVTGPLAQHAEGFRGELSRLGYTPLSSAGHMRLVAHLSRWLAAEGLDSSALTASTVKRYFADRRSAGYANERTARALRPLLDYLRAAGAAPIEPAPAPGSATEQLLADYGDYLRVERGLAPASVALNVRLVRPFLLNAAGRAGALELEELTAGDVEGFVLEQAAERPRSIKRIVTAVRSLLGFLYVEGRIDKALAEAVPTPAGWTLAGLPKALSESQVASLLGSCDPATATGRRDLAILTMLARLGLRAGEVAALALDDIDWRRGELVVRGKAHRIARLPLPGDVGERIVHYLSDGRPMSAQGRTVFVGAQAPHRALSSAGVTTVVTNAGRRVGLGTIGAHRLRHTAATAMLRKRRIPARDRGSSSPSTGNDDGHLCEVGPRGAAHAGPPLARSVEMTRERSLRDALEVYLRLRRALGFKLKNAGRLLGQFVDHLEAQGVDTITTDTALTWASLPSDASTHWRAIRLSVVRGFATYLHGIDPSAEIPPPGLLRSGPCRATPYLYSTAEVESLIGEAARLRPALRAATYSSLIGLLAVSGIRIGEALALDDQDLDVEGGVLVVRNSKFDNYAEDVVMPTLHKEALACADGVGRSSA